MTLDTSPHHLNIGDEAAQMIRELRLFKLDGAVVAFSEPGQSLFELAPIAQIVVDAIKTGISVWQIPEILTAGGMVCPENAGATTAETLNALCTAAGKKAERSWNSEPNSILSAAPDAANVTALTFAPIAIKSYKLLDTRFEIRFAQPRQVTLVDSILGHLIEDDRTTSCKVTIDLPAARHVDQRLATYIIRDKVYIGYASRLSLLGPMVKAAMWQSAVNSYNFLFYIHAGVIARGGRCLLLPAPAGSGKSSLTIALTASGFDYFSDEIAIIEKETFRVPAVRLAMCVKSSGWDVVAPYYPGIADLPVHIRSDAKAIRYLPPPSRPEPATATVSHIVFPRYRPGGKTTLVRLERSEALGRLMSECLALRASLTGDISESILRWISRVDCYSLEYSSLQECIPIIKGMFSPP